jgi:hypothetical protein
MFSFSNISEMLPDFGPNSIQARVYNVQEVACLISTHSIAYLAASTATTTDKLQTRVPASVSELYMDCAHKSEKRVCKCHFVLSQK